MNNEITFFAKTNFRNQERVFGIKTDDRRRHMYIIGKTGMGKTNLLENMVIQDIRNGHGVCYIDPHGDTAEKLLKAVPKERINDILYFNPADQQFPIAFNVMESVNPEYRHLVASGLVSVFKKIWADSWGPRLEYILRNAIMALLETPGTTLLGVTRILVDKKYREKIVANVTDPVIKQFWVDEFSKWSDKVLQEVVSPIQNKVGQFLSNSLMRNIVGQTQSSFDVRQMMDERKVIIMNLSKGRIGEDASALLGAMMITKIQLAAMGRVDMPEEARHDFYLYVDEFQNFATDSFANILSEARKYRLNLIMANQYVEQIREEVRNAIFGNAGTIISFRVGATDAEFLEKEFAPVFVQNDIVNLAKYNIYLKLMIDGIAGDAFSATTLPPIYLGETLENESTIIKVSRERYAKSKAQVEADIAQWSGMAAQERMQNIVAANSGHYPPQQPRSYVEYTNASENARPAFSSQPQNIQSQDQQRAPEFGHATPTSASEVYQPAAISPVEPPMSPLFDAVCDTCGEEMRVPFKPDGKRPTFCKDCLKDYQRMMAKTKLGEERKKQRQQIGMQEPQATGDAIGPAQDVPQQQSARQATTPISEQQASQQTRHIERKAYAPQEKPLSLSQMQRIAPKGFKPQRQRQGVDLGAVRKMINTAKNEN